LLAAIFFRSLRREEFLICGWPPADVLVNPSAGPTVKRGDDSNTKDLVVVKTRYSGFAGTTLDSQLRTRGIRYLFFAGIATNVCVESTLRDAYSQDYWPILIADGTMPAGPPSLQEATLFNVENFFGWTIRSQDFLAAIQSSKP
jgi:nicotinamidase-related amidase